MEGSLQLLYDHCNPANILLTNWLTPPGTGRHIRAGFKTATINRSVTRHHSIPWLFYDLKPSIGAERLGYNYAAIGLLVVLQERDDYPGQG